MDKSVTEEEEETGLDLTQHGESGYSDDFGFGSVSNGSLMGLAPLTTMLPK